MAKSFASSLIKETVQHIDNQTQKADVSGKAQKRGEDDNTQPTKEAAMKASKSQ